MSSNYAPTPPTTHRGPRHKWTEARSGGRDSAGARARDLLDAGNSTLRGVSPAEQKMTHKRVCARMASPTGIFATGAALKIPSGQTG